MHRPVLLLRVAPSPPPPPSGRLLDDLGATRTHDRTCSWVAARERVHEGALSESDRRAWDHGRNLAGLRMGLAFEQQGSFFVPHPAPGQVSVTCGLTGDSLTPWLRGIGVALSGERVVVQLDAERFVVELRANGRLRIRAVDPDGTEEGRLLLEGPPLIAALHDELQSLDALLAAADALGRPLPASDLREAAAAIHALRDRSLA